MKISIKNTPVMYGVYLVDYFVEDGVGPLFSATETEFFPLSSGRAETACVGPFFARVRVWPEHRYGFVEQA
jgi:hypothetical protein